MVTYLSRVTADLAILPFRAAQSHDIFDEVVIGGRSESVVDAGQLFSEEALLPTVTAHGTSSGFVLRGVGLVGAGVTC